MAGYKTLDKWGVLVTPIRTHKWYEWSRIWVQHIPLHVDPYALLGDALIHRGLSRIIQRGLSINLIKGQKL